MITISVSESLLDKDKFQDLVNSIKSSFPKQFPHGWIQFSKMHLSQGINISFGAIGDNKLLTGGYLENDPMIHKFGIEFKDGLYTVEKYSGSIKVKPNQPNMVMQSIKTAFRKATGNEAKTISSMNAFFVKLKQQWVENGPNVYNRNKYPDSFF